MRYRPRAIIANSQHGTPHALDLATWDPHKFEEILLQDAETLREPIIFRAKRTSETRGATIRFARRALADTRRRLDVSQPLDRSEAMRTI